MPDWVPAATFSVEGGILQVELAITANTCKLNMVPNHFIAAGNRCGIVDMGLDRDVDVIDLAAL